VTYYQELGEVSADQWCSDNNSPVFNTSCQPVSGLCLPMTADMLTVFKDIQRNTNRLLAKSGFTKFLDVDGRIGPATVKAVGDMMAQSFAGCDDIARNAIDLREAIINQAEAIGAALVPDPVPSSPPSLPRAGGGVSHPPENVLEDTARQQAGILGLLKSPLGIAAAAIAAILLWKVTAPPGATRRRTRGR
jgi:hypothetical protein